MASIPNTGVCDVRFPIKPHGVSCATRRNGAVEGGIDIDIDINININTDTDTEPDALGPPMSRVRPTVSGLGRIPSRAHGNTTCGMPQPSDHQDFGVLTASVRVAKLVGLSRSTDSGETLLLGHSHATSGALAFAAAATLVPVAAADAMELIQGPVRISAMELVLGTLITAGAALLPDIDHPKGTIAQSLGPVSHYLAKGVSTISGGHRHATHSLLFVILAGWATWAGQHFLGRPFTLGLVFVMLAFGVRALHLSPSGDSLRAYGLCVIFAGAGTILMHRWLPDTPRWLPFAIGLGCLIHLVGDCLTERGCPLLWPLKQRAAIPVISRTGNKVETWILTPLMGVGTLVLLYLYAVP